MNIIARTLVFSFLFFLILPFALSWDSNDCSCEISGMQQGLKSGQGNTARCSWSDKTDPINVKKIELVVYDQGDDYSKLRQEVKIGKEAILKRIEGNKNYELVEDEDSAVVYFEDYSLFSAWANYIRGNGYNFKINADNFKSMSEVKEKMKEVEKCVVKMTESRMNEESLSKNIEADEEKERNKGSDLEREEKIGGFFWNVRYWLNRMIARDTPLPFVEEAIDEIGASNCSERGINEKECYRERAIKSQNYYVCEESDDPSKCYAAVASLKNDPLICDKMRDYIKWGRKKMVVNCYKWFGSEAKDVDVCLKIPYKSEMEECFMGAAKNLGDADICDRLKYPDRCKVCVSYKTGDKSICEKITDKDAKKACEFKETAGSYCTGLGRLFQDSDISGYGSAAASRG